MTNNILLFFIALSFIGFLMACLATTPSFGQSLGNVTIPHDEIEITFDPYQEEIIPIVSITIPHDEIEITFIPVK